MNALGVFYGHSLITDEMCKKVESLTNSVHCWYNEGSKQYEDSYTRDPASGLWNWVTDEYDDDDDWDSVKSSMKPSLNTETVIEYVRQNVLYNDAGVEVE